MITQGTPAPSLLPGQINPAAPPTMQNVDQQGTPETPQGNDAGMATLANPGQPVNGGATLQQILQSKGQSLPQVNSPTLNKLNDGMNAATQAQAASGQPPKPGDWARSLVAGAQSMLGAGKAIGSSLGDAAAVGTVPKGGGALTGIARTLGARNERVRQQRLDQQAATKDQMLMAEANARMINEQALTHKLGEEAIQASIDAGNRTVAKLKTAASAPPPIAEGLTSDELTEYLKKNNIDPSKETAYPTGRKQVGENKDGTPIYRTTYTAMGVPPDVDLNPDVAKDKEILDDMNRYSPPATGGKWGLQGIQHVSGAQFNMIMQQVEEGRAATAARDKALADQKLSKEATDFIVNPPQEWLKALKEAPGHDPIAARNLILNDPDLSAKLPHLDSVLKGYFGEKNYDTMLDDYQKRLDAHKDYLTETTESLEKADGQHAAEISSDLDKAIQDPKNALIVPQLRDLQARANAKANASLDFDKQKKQQDADIQAATKSKEDQEKLKNESAQGDLTLTGDAYIKSLPAGHQDIVRKILQGQLSLAANRKEGLQLIAEAAHADPVHWDEEKAKKWQKTDNEYTGSGKTAGGLVRANVALKHAKELYDTLNLSGVLNPLSKDYQDRQIAAGRLTDEIGAAIKGGVVTKEEGEKMFADINGGVTIANKKERVKKVVQLLYDKIEGAQDKYDDAAPSSYVTPKRLLSPRGQAAYDYIQSDGKKNNRELLETGPSNQGGGTVKMTSPDGSVTMDIPADQVEYYKGKGAKVAQQP